MTNVNNNKERQVCDLFFNLVQEIAVLSFINDQECLDCGSARKTTFRFSRDPIWLLIQTKVGVSIYIKNIPLTLFFMC